MSATTHSFNALQYGKRIVFGPPFSGWTGAALRVVNLAASISVLAYGIRGDNEVALSVGLLWTTASASFAIIASTRGIEHYADRNWSVEVSAIKNAFGGGSVAFGSVLEVLALLAYQLITVLVAITVFLGVWISLVSEYGLLVGGLLGWIPAVILAALAALLWPVAVVTVYYFARHST